MELGRRPHTGWGLQNSLKTAAWSICWPTKKEKKKEENIGWWRNDPRVVSVRYSYSENTFWGNNKSLGEIIIITN